MSEDTDVMFRIGVMDHPESKTALQGLAAAVEAAQARMTSGVVSIGETARRVAGMVDELASKTASLGKNSSGDMRTRSAIPDSVVAQSKALESSLDKIEQKIAGIDVSTLSKSMRDMFVEIETVSKTTGDRVTAQWGQRLTDLADSFNTNMERMRQSAGAGIGTQPSVPSATTGSTDAVSAQVSAVNNAVDTMQRKVDSFDTSKLSSAMRNVFDQLGSEHVQNVEDIVETVEAKIAELPISVKAQAEILRNAYAAQMVEHSEAYASMAQDLDGYLAKNGSTIDQIAANLRRGEAALQQYRDSAARSSQESNKMFVQSALHVAQVAKGLATIGLVSEENAQKFMQSLAVIQGTFDVLKGAIDAYDKFGKGIQKAREAQQMLTKAQAAASAVETAQLAQVRAYHAALVQEAAAANAAAAANGRLAASRSAAGASGAAAAAGSAVSGAGSAGGGLLRGIGGLGGLVGGAGAAAAGATAAAGAAAAGGVYLGGRAIYESASGQSTQSDSSIAALEARLGAWTLRLTGLFESTDAPMVKFAQAMSSMADNVLNWVPGGDFLKNLNLIGDFAGLAASQAGVERGEASLAKNRINNDADRKLELVDARAEMERENLRFKVSSDDIRSRAANGTSSFGFEGQTQETQAQWQAMQERLRMRNVKDEGVIGQSVVSQASDDAARKRGNPDAAFVQMSAEAEVLALATKRYADAKDALDKTVGFAGSSDEERALATERARVAQDDMVRSLERHAQLARQSGANRLAIEKEIQQTAMSAIEQQAAKLDALDNRRKSAMRSFVSMDALDRDMAIKALEKARAGGGASLSQMESDLLGRIGTDETSRFVDESTEAQAKKFGFDATFGSSIDDTRKQIEGTRQQLEAQLQASFDVSMKVEADTDRVVDAILPQVERAISDMTEAIERSLEEKLRDQRAEINTQRGKDLAALKNGR